MNLSRQPTALRRSVVSRAFSFVGRVAKVTGLCQVGAGGFRPHELSEIEGILANHQDDLRKAWQKEQQKRVNYYKS